MTASEAAEYMKRTRSQVCYICKQGGFNGARKIGHQWLIPKQSVINYKPGPRGFAKVRANIEAHKAIELAEQNEAIRKAKGLPVDDSSPAETETVRDEERSFITVEKAAEILGRSRRQVRQFCAWGRIAGAFKSKVDKSWIIPYDEVLKFSATLDKRTKRQKQAGQ